MVDIYLTNSLTRKKEKFTALNPPNVGVYTCGPTVYDYAHIVNYRTYTTADLLVRVLKYSGFKVNYIMNLTDVGHLTGDNIGDADVGEDRMEKAAKKEGKTAWDIAKFYSEIFIDEMHKLNLLIPNYMPRATDHIREQIELVKKLKDNGFTYQISDGIYFDTLAFEKKTGKRYGELSTLDVIKEGARVEPNPEKKNPRDFALWKFSYPGGRSFDHAQDDAASRRHMEWESPWGIGFPGWHIECSAMSMKYLGESFDIHLGGEDLRQTHHPNEIAQSEAATGKSFVRYWVHVTHLKVDGKKMSKSKGNFYTLGDIKKRGFDPLALRYLYLTAHYRDTLNFTWESLKASQTTLANLRKLTLAVKNETSRTSLSPEKRKKVDNFVIRFQKAINDDLDTPQALSILWQAIKSNVPSEDKYDLIVSLDEVLGLRLAEIKVSKLKIPDEIKKAVQIREKFRAENKFKEADKIRNGIEKKGFVVEDAPEGPKVKSGKN